MPPKAKQETIDDAAPAVEESVDPKADLVFDFNGENYQFKRKRLNATQFRLPMQKGFNESAVEWLLGPAQFALFLSRNLDDDGCTPETVFYDFVEALGQEIGAGNS